MSNLGSFANDSITGAAGELHALARRVPALFISLGVNPEAIDCGDPILFAGRACREVLGEECPDEAIPAMKELVRRLWDTVVRLLAERRESTVPRLISDGSMARLGSRLFYAGAEQLVDVRACSCGAWRDPRCCVPQHRLEAQQDSMGRTRLVMKSIRAKRLETKVGRFSILCFGTGAGQSESHDCSLN